MKVYVIQKEKKKKETMINIGASIKNKIIGAFVETIISGILVRVM